MKKLTTLVQCGTPFSALLKALAGAMLLAAAPALHAAGSYTVAASATILSKNNCTFSTTTGTLAFGTIDPSSGTNATATPLTLTFRCTGTGNPASYSITSNDGTHRLGAGRPQMVDNQASPTSWLAYTLNTPINGTTPHNTNTNVQIEGTITPAQFQGAAATSYTDTVVLTLSP